MPPHVQATGGEKSAVVFPSLVIYMTPRSSAWVHSEVHSSPELHRRTLTVWVVSLQSPARKQAVELIAYTKTLAKSLMVWCLPSVALKMQLRSTSLYHCGPSLAHNQPLELQDPYRDPVK